MDSSLTTISASSLKKNLPRFRVGQTVRIHQRIKEGEKERIQVFEGLIIQMSNGTGVNGTITVRKIVDGIGVERVFAIHSPLIAKIEIKKIAKVRRSKLYYIRSLTGKSARLRTTLLEGQVFEPKPMSEDDLAKDKEDKVDNSVNNVADPEEDVPNDAEDSLKDEENVSMDEDKSQKTEDTVVEDKKTLDKSESEDKPDKGAGDIVGNEDKAGEVEKGVNESEETDEKVVENA